MMVISYTWGQKSYPVPYAWKKLLSYMVIVAIFYFVHHGIIQIWHNEILNLTIATFLLFLFGLFIYRVERKEMDGLLNSVMKISIFRR
jgi:small neutral amino acid transporter SnatA (MarC family)